MELIITVPDDAIEQVKTNVLAVMPIPKDSNGDLLYTPLAWVQKVLTEYLKRLHRQGHNKLLEKNNPVVDIDQ